MASAAPSTGSVPEPSSSISTSEFGVICVSIEEMFAMCAENVESDCSMRLFVADVRKNSVKKAYFRLVAARHKKSRLCHQAEKPRRFQRNGFAARVGSRHYQRGVFIAKSNVYGNASIL